MFQTIEYLNGGNERQQKAYSVIKTLGVMKDLADFQPVLCGTIPIGIDVEGSDLDIIFEVNDFPPFRAKVESLYHDKQDFRIKETKIRNLPVLKANFMFGDFEFELFAQPQPVFKQYAYIHMLIEYHLMKEIPQLREKVIGLKQQGYKTEPAFCIALGLEGDPYEKLIEFARK
ncbi:DUF4269 domain-containing protein [Bacillus sp. Bva_UNVM-123]|uniref:DUF4269 domain-containing protein n=1 Tax=Bacillus sp. Bva_UNVM-123 TaxID=2829798 RepID=UPI00391EF718